MFDALENAQSSLTTVLSGLDPPLLRGADAVRLLGLFTQIERLAAAGRTTVAGRASATNAWQRAGHRTAAAWLAAETDQSVGTAITTLETSARLEELPATSRAFRSGEISEARAKEIASAVAHAPDHEEDLLQVARTASLSEVKDACRMLRATAATGESARYDAIRRSRSFRSWTESDGAVRLDARLAPDDGAAVLAAIDQRKERIFADARRAGRREPFRAYAADALVALITARDGSVPAGPRATVHVRVDHQALVRGHAEPGETCEIPGVGPIPVATARALASDSILKVLVTDGPDVRAVAHAGRTIPARVRTAVEARDQTCVVTSCGIRHGLQIDHRVPFAAGGPTTLENLNRLCRWHHHLKTHCGYRLEGEPGACRWLSPDDQQGEAARPPPAA